MKRNLVKLCHFVLAVASVFAFSACSSTSSAGPSPLKSAAVIGLSGAALGAGAGAIFGAVVPDGLVAESAAVGAGVGLAVGAAAGAIYTHQKRAGALSDRNSEISDLSGDIAANEAEIQALRAELDQENRDIAVSGTDNEHLYQSHSLGNPYQ